MEGGWELLLPVFSFSFSFSFSSSFSFSFFEEETTVFD
jgi:hypothetical protein